MRKLGAMLTVLILLVAMASVYAKGGPPDELVSFIRQYPVVYDKTCNVESQKLKDVECLILAVDRETVFVVLFTSDGQTITHIFLANRKEEKLLWSGAI